MLQVNVKGGHLQYLKFTSQVPSELLSYASLTTNIAAAILFGGGGAVFLGIRATYDSLLTLALGSNNNFRSLFLSPT